jgi:hypothetical protein
VVVRIPPGLERVNYLGKVHVVGCAAAEREHANLLARVAPAIEHEVVLEHVHALEQGGVVGRDELGPVSRIGSGGRHAHQPEIRRALVGEHEEIVAVVLGRVLDPLSPRQQDSPLVRRPGGRQIAHLARGEAGALRQEIGPVPGLAQGEKVERVGLAHDHRLGRVTEGATVDAVGPVRGGVAGEEERPVVGRPLEAVAHAVHHIGEEPAGAEVLDPNGVPLGAGGIVGVCQELSIGAHLPRPDARVRVPSCRGVLIQQHLLGGRHAAPPPAEDRVLLPLLGPGVVVEPVHQLGDGEVGLPDVAHHLVEQRILQRPRVPGHRFRIRVLTAQIVEHFRPFAPVVTQPEVRIAQHNTGYRIDVGNARGHRRGRSGTARRCLSRETCRSQKGRQRHDQERPAGGEEGGGHAAAP